jgi:hypothetical protein
MLNVAGTLQARRYRHEVELFTQEEGMDEANRQTLGELVSQGVFPADIKPLSYGKKMYLFQSSTIQAYEVTLRHIDFEPTKAKYEGVMLGVTLVEDVDLRGRRTRLLIAEAR